MWSRRSFLTVPTALALGARTSRSQNAPEFTAGITLVLAPATVTERSGRLVRGILPEQFVLIDDGTRRPVVVEEDPQPLSLVLAVHASFEARKPLDRLRKAVSLFGPLVIGADGTAGVVAFRDDVETVVPLTSAFESVSNAVRGLDAKGSGCSLVDAVQASAGILGREPPNRRKVIVIVTEDRDRSSRADLKHTLMFLQKQNITVYPLTYSPGLMQFGREVPPGP